MSLVASNKGLRGVWFVGQKYFEAGLNQELLEESHPILEETARLLDAYFAGENVDFSSLSLDLEGTDFQQKVWTILRTIPAGQVTSYGQIAKDLNHPSPQAIGGAVGRNPISVIIPCHRVLNSQGKLTGYAGGLDKKMWLLQHENPRIEVKE